MKEEQKGKSKKLPDVVTPVLPIPSVAPPYIGVGGADAAKKIVSDGVKSS